MPSRYRHDTSRLKVEIAARVAAGESLRAIGASAGMPGAHAMRNWARADAGFAAELAAARARAQARPFLFDEAVAAQFLDRARSGETINDLLRAPGMPGRRAYRYWLMTQGPFAEAVFGLRQRRDQDLGRHGRARRRDWDPALGDRIIVGMHRGASLAEVLAGDPAMPCLPVVRRWRREQKAFDAVVRGLAAAWRRRRATAPGLTPELTEEIVGRIVEGGSFRSIGAEPGMPSRQTLRRWVRVRPEFAEVVAWACEHREDWFHDQMAIIAEEAAPGTMAQAKRRMGPLKRQLVRLRHRPGAVHRKPGAPGPTSR